MRFSFFFLAAILQFISCSTMAICQTSFKDENEMINVLDYGVTINDNRDDDALIISRLSKEISLDGGGVIFLPNGIYHLKSPIEAHDNIEYRGESVALTILHNTITRNYANSFVFTCGWYHEDDHDDVTQYPIKSIKSGQNFIELENFENTESFKIDDIIIIRQGALPKKLDKSHKLSLYAKLYKINSIDLNSGKIILENNIDDALVNQPPLKSLTITKLEGGQFGGRKTYITKNVKINNITVKSERGNWMSRDAVYKGIFENIHILKSNTLLGGNGKQGCVFKDISGNFTTRFIEMAEGSSDNKIINIKGTKINGGKTNKTYPLMIFRSGDTLENFTLSSKTALCSNVIIRGIKNIYIKNGKIDTYLRGPVFLLKGNGNYVENLELDLRGNQLGAIVKDAGKLTIQNCSISGFFTKQIVQGKNNNLNFINNKISTKGGKPKEFFNKNDSETKRLFDENTISQ